MDAFLDVAHTHNGDPFHPPGGLMHFKSTILWSVLPEVMFFSAVAAGTSLAFDSSSQLEPGDAVICDLWAQEAGGTRKEFIITNPGPNKGQNDR